MSAVNSPRLPQEFSDLEIWCDKWCLTSFANRNKERYSTPIDEIQAFYDVMISRAEGALEYLSGIKPGELNARQENLLKLLLSLAEVGPAVEWFGESRITDGYDPQKVKLVLPIPENVSLN